MKLRFVSSFILFFLLIGCQNTTTQSVERNTPTVPSYFTPSITPSIMPSPVPTATIQPTHTAPVGRPSRKCLDIASSYSWQEPLPGTLILTASGTLRKNYLLDMSAGTKHPLHQSGNIIADDFTVSPNGKWLAYDWLEDKPKSTEFLTVQSEDGKKFFTYPKDYQEWRIIAYWLNDEELVLWNPQAGALGSIVLINPFTGEKQVMEMDYPDILANNFGWDQWPTITIYDPTLRRLVYLKERPGDYKPVNATLALWDRRENRLIAKIDDFGGAVPYPLWKSDGSGLVYVKALSGNNILPHDRHDELYYLSVDGKNQQLTRLSDDFPNSLVYSTSFSPDGKYLAFVIFSGDSNAKYGEFPLLIMDLSSLEIRDYCLEAEYSSRLVWSPDSRYLAYSEPQPSRDDHAIVLDLLKEKAFVVDPNLNPEGWMVSKK